MTETLYIKLGGSVITFKDKPKTEDIKTIRMIAQEIKEALEKKKLRLVIGTGGGSYPHPVAKKYEINKGMHRENSRTGFALTQFSAAEINRIVVKEFLDAGIDAISMQPSAFEVNENGKIARIFPEPVENLLKLGMLPVVYGDIVTDTRQGCSISSTEKTLAALAEKLGGKRIIMCADVDGVFTANPKDNPNAKLIEELTPKNFEAIKKGIAGSSATDVTGGMLHKVESMLELAHAGFECLIVNGKKPGVVKSVLLGEKVKGTRIHK